MESLHKHSLSMPRTEKNKAENSRISETKSRRSQVYLHQTIPRFQFIGYAESSQLEK